MDWREEAQVKLDRMPDHIKSLRKSCLKDLRVFARTFNPNYMYGDIHMEIYKEMMNYNLFGQGEGLTANKLILLPRAHLKSHMVATWTAWIIARHPEITLLYVSATAELAEQQLFAIQQILGGSKFQKLFPEYVNPQEGKREKWNSKKLIIDHIKRFDEGIRDPTVATAGLTTNTTGWHADIIVPDDLMVPENAYTEEGRESVRKKSSQFTSIRNAGGFTMACGTRYHPNDIYDTWSAQSYSIYDESTGEQIDELKVWDFMERKVEVDDVFIWAQQIRDDGKAFGFNRNILSRIKAEYEDKTQFYAQYYNNPNEKGSNRVDRTKFQYYDKKNLKYTEGRWFINGKPLNLYASIDFAFTMNRKADYTAIVVIGMDPDGFIYVIDIDRFKTNKIAVYFDHILDLHAQYYFKKMRAEVTVAQAIIVEDIKDMIRKEGMSLAIDEHRPNRHQGSKEVRIASVLEPRYENNTIWHYKGGHVSALEEEVVLARPKHDDIKDALASAIEIAKPPRRVHTLAEMGSKVSHHPRFGGVRFNSTRTH